MKLRTCAIAVLACSPFLNNAHATVLSTWSWTDTVSTISVAGKVVFSTQQDGGGYDLVIDLYNTSTVQPTSTAQLLTGLYFDISPSPGPLKMRSAIAPDGLLNDVNNPTVVDPLTLGANMCAPFGAQLAPDPTDLPCVAPASGGSAIDGGWQAAYQFPTGIGGGANANQHWGIGTSGQTGVFQGNHVNAFNYSIAGTIGVTGTQGGLTNEFLYAYGYGQFVLSGLSSEDITISNVSGAYGTAPEGTPAAQEESDTPEPATVTGIAGGLIALAMKRLRRN